VIGSSGHEEHGGRGRGREKRSAARVA
jgi:hypothetical protein